MRRLAALLVLVLAASPAATSAAPSPAAKRCAAAKQHAAKKRTKQARKAARRACAKPAKKPAPAPVTVPAAPVAETPVAPETPADEPAAPAETPATETVAPPAAPLLRTLGITQREFTLSLSRTEVGSGVVTVQVVNRGEDPHDLRLEDLGGTELAFWDELEPFAALTRQVTLAAGTYRVYCTLPGHAAAGMDTRLTVRDG